MIIKYILLGKYRKIINRKIYSSITIRGKTTMYLLNSLYARTHIYKLDHSVNATFVAFSHLILN